MISFDDNLMVSTCFYFFFVPWVGLVLRVFQRNYVYSGEMKYVTRYNGEGMSMGCGDYVTSANGVDNTGHRTGITRFIDGKG